MMTIKRCAQLWTAVLGLAGLLPAGAQAAAAGNVTNARSSAVFTTVREAVDAAAAGDTLHLSAGIFTASGLTLSKDLTLRGAGAEVTLLQAADTAWTGSNRLFWVTNAQVVMEDLTLRHGCAPNSGGAVGCVQGTVKLSRCILSHNRVTISGPTTLEGGGGAAFGCVLHNCLLVSNEVRALSQVTRPQRCVRCHSRGWKSPPGWLNCSDCRGSGLDVYSSGVCSVCRGLSRWTTEGCSACNGFGFSSGKECGQCEGWGRLPSGALCGACQGSGLGWGGCRRGGTGTLCTDCYGTGATGDLRCRTCQGWGAWDFCSSSVSVSIYWGSPTSRSELCSACNGTGSIFVPEYNHYVGRYGTYTIGPSGYGHSSDCGCDGGYINYCWTRQAEACGTCGGSGMTSGTAGPDIWGGAAWRCTLVNCTVADNLATTPSGGAAVGGTADCRVTNSIIWFNGTNHARCVLHAVSTSPGGSGSAVDTRDPLFLGRDVMNYRVAPFSPCLDRANPLMAPAPSDLDRRPRTAGVAPDLGAYEARPSGSPGFLLSATNLVVAENGGKVTLGVMLSGLPQSTVVLTVSNLTPADLLVEPTSLTFTPDTAPSPQTLTLTGVNDFLVPVHTGLVSVAVAPASSDPAWSAVPMQTIQVACLNDDSPPTVPTAVSASDGLDATKIRVTWRASAGADLYRVFRNVTNSTNDALLVGVATLPSWDDNRVPAGTNFYWIQASNAVGLSFWSAPDSGWRRPAPPPSPAPLVAGFPAPGQVELRWTNSAEPGVQYRLERRLAGTGSWLPLAVLGSNVLTHTDGAVTNGQSWDYRVCAFNAEGSSAFATVQASLLAPGVTSTNRARGTAGYSFSYQITASNWPSAFAAPGLPPGLSLAPASGLISGYPLQGGTFIVNLAASNVFGAGWLALTLDFAKQTQAIIFPQPPNVGMGDTSLRLQLQASSHLPVTLSVLSGPASMLGSLVLFTNRGTVTLRASQAGDPMFLPAPDVDRSLIVDRRSQTLTFPPIADCLQGGPPLALRPVASSGLPVTLVQTGGGGVLAGDLYSPRDEGLITLVASQPGDGTYESAPQVTRTFRVRGPTWQPVSIPATQDLVRVLFDGARFTAVATNLILQSPDGLSWTALTGTNTWPLRGRGLSRVTRPVFGNGTFLAAGQIANSCRDPLFETAVYASLDGGGFLAGSRLVMDPADLAFGEGQFVVLGTRWQMPASGCVPVAGTDLAVLSPNGSDWVEQALPPAAGSGHWQRLFHAGGVFMAWDPQSGRVLRSTNGLDWQGPSSAGFTPDDLIFGNGRWAGVCSQSTPALVFSADGAQWTAASPQPPFQPAGITFGLDQFVAVGAGLWTGEGSSWTATATTQALNGVVFGDRRFVAVGARGTVYLSYHAPPSSSLPPQFLPDLHVAGIRSTPFSFQVGVSNPPALFGAEGLPAGLSLDSVSGVIAGVPAETGTFTVTLRGANGAGISTASLDLVITASPPGPPEILVQPVSRTVLLGAPASFQVIARGLPGLQYQWYHDGTPVAHATQACVGFVSASAGDAGEYWAVLTHTNGATTSLHATLDVLLPPSLVTTPASLQVPPGGMAVFGAHATGATPLNYQWRFNGSNLPGETHTNLVLPTVGDAVLGSYEVVVSNVAGVVTSTPPAVLAYGGPPVVLVPPAPLEVLAGRSALLAAEVRGANPISFEWRRNGNVVPGATGPSLAIASAREEDAGDYEVVARNAVGAVTSRPPARLSVILPPRMLVAPASVGVAYGNPATFQVVATSAIPFSCQWRFNGTNLAGATGLTLSLTNVQLAQAGNYTVVLSNAAGVTISDPPALLSFAGIATILSPPQAAEVLWNRPASFQVLAVGTLPLQFQWMRDGVIVPGATNASLLIPAARANDAGLYTVAVRNSFGSVTSQPPARLNVILPPSFGSVPATAAFLAGTATTLSASATSAIAFTWQWQCNGTNLPGATQSFLTLSNVQPATAGLYTVVATSAAGAVTSTPPAGLICVLPPHPMTVMAGEPLLVPCELASPVPLELQWRRNGLPIPGQQESTLVLSPAQASDAGQVTLAISHQSSLLLVTPPVGLTVGVWGEPALEGAVRQALGLTSGVITHSQLLGLRYLSADGLGLTNLTGLELATNLSSLYLGGNALSDLSPLGGLAQLSYLYLQNNRVADLTPLAGLTNLASLYLDNNQVSDLSPLASLRALTALCLGRNRVASLGPLAGLTALRVLEAPRNALTDLIPLNSLLGLETLDLSFNPIGDITPLASLSGLRYLRLGGLALLSLTPLANLSALESLDIHDNWVTDLNPLTGSGRLRYLDASQNGLRFPPGSPNAAVVESIRNRGGWSHTSSSKSFPAIVVGPQDRLLNTGEAVTFQVVAAGQGPLRYQWRCNDIALPGATNDSLLLSNLQPALSGLYSVEVWDDLGAVVSEPPARLRVVPTGSPRIMVPPASQRVGGGFTAVLQVTAEGTLPLSCEWWHNGTRLAGPDGPVLTLSGVGQADAGSYWVVVRNPLGAATSAPPAVLTVDASTVIAWGDNHHGQTNVPAGLGEVVALAAGFTASAALTVGGGWVFWGDTAQFPQGGTDWMGLAPGPGSGLGLHPDGTVADPTGATTPTNVLQIASDPWLEASLALKADGTVAAWGRNDYGQLAVPAGLEGVVGIAAALGHFLALKHDGTLAAWGDNAAGQCNIPPEATNVVQIAAHYGRSFALRQDGRVLMWGEYSRSLEELGLVTRIAAGVYGCLALRADGTVAAYNTYAPALSNAVLLAAGYCHHLALVSPALAPVIFPQPRGLVVAPGRPVLFRSDAVGSLPLTCQWRRDGTDLPGATHPWLYLPSPALEDSGVYTFTASNAFGSVSSTGARLLVDLSLATPAFTRVPAAQTVREDETATFVAEVSGALPLRGQWFCNGAPIPGATDFTCVVGPIQTTHAGFYAFGVSNAHGAITSAPALLTVLPGFARALDTTNLVWSTSGDCPWISQFDLSHDGTDAARSGLPPSAADSAIDSSLDTTVTGPGLLTFWVRMDCLEWASPYLSLRLDHSYPSVLEWSGRSGWARAALFVPSGLHPLTWRFTHRGDSVAWLDQVAFQPGLPAPILTALPASVLTATDGSAHFEVTATGAPPLAFQWQHDGTSLPGATNRSLLLSNLQPAQAGAYRVIVSNPSGAVTSSPPATLTLLPNQLVNLPDPVLESLVRSTLSKATGPLMTLDLLGLTQLGSPYSYPGLIRSLSGLEAAINLTNLTLNSAQVTNFAPLASLPRLQTVALANNSLAALPGWGALPNLLELDLHGNPLTNLAPLSNLVSLQILNLGDCTASDLGPLIGLTNLGSLNLASCDATNLPPLDALVNLKSLDLSYTRLTDLTPVAALRSLTNLTAEGVGLTDLSPLQTLPHLCCLQLRYNWITNLSALAGLGLLRELTLDENQVTDLTPLAGLTNLVQLSLIKNRCADLAPLAGLTRLESLSIYFTGCSDLSPLAAMASLNRLDAHYNSITDLGPLAGLRRLHYLDLAGNLIADAAPLRGLDRLFILWLAGNRITDLSPLANLTNCYDGFGYLYLSQNDLEVSPGSPARAAIDQLTRSGYEVDYLPQNARPSFTNPPMTLVASELADPILNPGLAALPAASLQWFRDGFALAGATNAPLILTSLTLAQAGEYRLLASNRLGATLSPPVTLSVVPLEPVADPTLDLAGWAWITSTNPWVLQTTVTHDGRAAWRSAPVGSDSKAILQTTLDGPGLLSVWIKTTFTYSWQGSLELYAGDRLLTNLTGTMDWRLLSVLVPPGNQPVRWVYSGGYNPPQEAAFLDETSFTPHSGPAILTVAPDQSTTAGSSVLLAAGVTGTAPLTFQWFRDGLPLAEGGRFSGAVSSNLLIANAQAGDAGLYTLRVSNRYAQVLSTPPAALVVDTNVPPAIASSPRSQTVCPGGFVTFSASATGPEPLTWRWFKDGTALSDGDRVAGATSAVLSLSRLEDSDQGTYLAVVTGWGGSATSAPALLTLSTVAPAVRSRVLAWGASSYGQTNVPATLTNAVAVEAGWGFSLALRSDGTVTAWGDTSYGQTNVPVGLTNVVAISAGLSGECLALGRDGLVTAWGGNNYGQRSVPAGLSNVVAISAGEGHCLALTAEGLVTAWGRNDYGQATVPAGLDGVVGVAAGYRFSLALKADGTVVKWGTGGGTLPASLTNAVEISVGESLGVARCRDGRVLQWNTYYTLPAEATNLMRIAAGAYHVLALRSNGALLAWGDTASGKTALPAEATNLLSVAGGYSHTLAVVGEPGLPQALILPASLCLSEGQSGTLHARILSPGPFSCQWQRNGVDIPGATNAVLYFAAAQAAEAGVYTVVVRDAQGLGISPPVALTTRPNPAILALSAPARALQGGTATFAVQAAGTGPLTYRWQLNGSDLSDRETVAGAASPMLVLRGLCPASAGAYRVRIAGPGGATLSPTLPLMIVNATAWGNNSSAQSSVPLDATNLVAVAGGTSFTLGLRADGSVTGWGQPPAGATNWTQVRQLSARYMSALGLRTDGTLLTANSPSAPAGFTNFTSVEVGFYGAQLALTPEGTVVAWGDNTYGQTNLPANLGRVTAIAAGGGHCLALRQDGTVVAWGRTNYGMANVPPLATNAAAIAAGLDFNMILRRDGKLFVWGDSSLTNLPSSATNLVAIAAGGAHCLALRGNGTVVAWGSSSYGQSTVPSDLTNVVAISAGNYHSLAVTSNDCSGAGSPPFIVSQPVSLSVLAGQPAVFSVVAVGDAPLAYQWWFNSLPIPAATNSSYHLEAVQASQAGTYSVAVANPAGSVLSSNATLIVRAPEPLRFGSGPGGFYLLNGAFQARLTGSPGVAVLVEISEDLRTWQPFATNLIPEGGWLLSFPLESRPARFLRARPYTP